MVNNRKGLKMGEYWWVLDLVLVGLLFAAVYGGAKHGFIMTVLSFFAYLIAFVVTLPLSGIISETVYDGIVREKCINQIEDTVGDYDVPRTVNSYLKVYGIDIGEEEIARCIDGDGIDALADSVEAALKQNPTYIPDSAVAELNSALGSQVKSRLDGKLPEYVVDNMLTGIVPEEGGDALEMFRNGRASLGGTVKALTAPPRERAEYIEEHYFRKIVISIIKLIVFQIVFVILIFTFKILIKKFKLHKKIPGLRTADSLLGGLLGAVNGIVMIFIFALIIKLFIVTTGDTNETVNTDTVENTAVFELFYNVIE